MLRPSTGPSQPLIALYSDALPGAKRRSRGAGSCMGAKQPMPPSKNKRQLYHQHLLISPSQISADCL